MVEIWSTRLQEDLASQSDRTADPPGLTISILVHWLDAGEPISERKQNQGPMHMTTNEDIDDLTG